METVPFQLFKILGVESRLKIVQFLKEKGEAGAKEIAEFLGVTTAAASQHLNILKQAGLVTSRRDGFYIPYSIDKVNLAKCGEILNGLLGLKIKGEPAAEVSPDIKEMDFQSLAERKKKLMKELLGIQGQMAALVSQK